MGGSNDDEESLSGLVATTDVETIIYPLCTDAREEIEIHGDLNMPAAVLIGKLYSDLNDCTILFRKTVDAARLSDSLNDVPLPTNQIEMKKEFDEMMAAYSLYNRKECKLRAKCIQEVRAIEITIANLNLHDLTGEDIIHIHGFDPHIFTSYVLPKLYFITHLVFRFRKMSETLLQCYQKRLGLIKEDKEKRIAQHLHGKDKCQDDMDDESFTSWNSSCYCSFDEEDYITNDDSNNNSDKDDDEESIFSFAETPEEEPAHTDTFNKTVIKEDSSLRQISYQCCDIAIQTFGLFVLGQVGIEATKYLGSLLSDFLCR